MAERTGVISLTETGKSTSIKWKVPNLASVLDYNNPFSSPPFLCESEFCYARLDKFEVPAAYVRARQPPSLYRTFLRLRIFDKNGKEIVSFKNPEGGLFISRALIAKTNVLALNNYVFKENFGGWLLLSRMELVNIKNLPVTIFVELLRNGIKSMPHEYENWPLSLCSLCKLPGNLLFGLSEKLKESYLNSLHTDMTIKVQQKRFRVHKMIMAARSPVFAAMMRSDMKENKTNSVNVTDCDPDAFQVFLVFLYSGMFQDISTDNVINVYFVADKYGQDELKAECVAFMKKNLSVHKFCDTVELATKHNESELLKSCQRYFRMNARKVLKSDEWLLLLKDSTTRANEILLLLVPKNVESTDQYNVVSA